MGSILSLSNVSSDYITDALKTSSSTDTDSDGFSALLKSAMDMVSETNSLSNAAEEASLNFALGNSDNTHDLAVAQQKASLSLQYTVAVKNKVLEAYKEIMNIQI